MLNIISLADPGSHIVNNDLPARASNHFIRVSGTSERPTVIAYLHLDRLLRPHPGRVFVRHVQRLNIDRVTKIQECRARLTM